MIIQYNDIKREIRKMGLTQKEVAAILGITYPALWSRIKHGKPDIHLVIYALSHYYNKDDNLGERDL
jgi:predicted transcriptional regulator